MPQHSQSVRGKEMRKYRIVKAENVQGQIFNEAGPHFKDMEWMSERVMAELESIYNGNSRDITKLSNTMLRLLEEEVEDLNQALTMRKCTTG